MKRRRKTPIFLEMFTKITIEKIGNRKVKVSIFETEKTKISLILAILAKGEKFPPLVVFKGKEEGNLVKKITINSISNK